MTEKAATDRRDRRMKRALALGAKVVLPLIVLGAAAGIVMWMMQTAPKAERTPRERQARLVDVVMAEVATHTVRIEAHGTVRAARDVMIRPQISGEVIVVADELLPGGRLRAGDPILQVDPRDYELAVSQRESDLAQAKADLAVELGNQTIARREYELLGEELTGQERSLVLREPQLQVARATVAAAEAALGEAMLALERTRIDAPFDALVVDEFVDPGTRVTTQTDIARLVGTDTYWITLSVPLTDLRWVELPEDGRAGALVQLTQDAAWGSNRSRQGRVLQVLGDLSEQGRMARLLVAVDDPLALSPVNQGKPTLVLGAYLRAFIAGRSVPNSILVERKLLRDGDNVWIMTVDGTLEIRAVEIGYRGSEAVLVLSGIDAGERIVATDIAAAAPGMKLRLGVEAGSGAPMGGDS